jgi:hypothetical protein
MIRFQKAHSNGDIHRSASFSLAISAFCFLRRLGRGFITNGSPVNGMKKIAS